MKLNDTNVKKYIVCMTSKRKRKGGFRRRSGVIRGFSTTCAMPSTVGRSHASRHSAFGGRFSGPAGEAEEEAAEGAAPMLRWALSTYGATLGIHLTEDV